MNAKDIEAAARSPVRRLPGPTESLYWTEATMPIASLMTHLRTGSAASGSSRGLLASSDVAIHEAAEEAVLTVLVPLIYLDSEDTPA